MLKVRKERSKLTAEKKLREMACPRWWRELTADVQDVIRERVWKEGVAAATSRRY
jgi:hypothetical protein